MAKPKLRRKHKSKKSEPQPEPKINIAVCVRIAKTSEESYANLDQAIRAAYRQATQRLNEHFYADAPAENLPPDSGKKS